MKSFWFLVLCLRQLTIDCNLNSQRLIRYFKFVFPLFITFNLAAQITQPARYEHPHKNRDHEFIIISLKKNGLALVRDTEKFEEHKRIWEVIFLDTALNVSWETSIPIDNRMNILGHEYQDQNIYLIFQNPDSNGRLINLTEIDPKQKIFKQHEFKPEVNLRLTHFTILNEKSIFGGYINQEPALMLYNLAEEKAKIVPGIFQPNVDIMDVRTNTNGTFNVLLVEGRSTKAKKIIVRTYDAEGVMIVEDIIPLDDRKTVIEAITSSLIRDEMAIIGTWTYGSGSKAAAGIFSVIVDPFNEQKVNYYDFAQLNHFLDYLKPKRIAKIKAKAEWRRSVGKPVEFRVNLSAVKIEETENGFIFLGEIFESPSRGSYRSTPYPYGYTPYYSPYSMYGFSPFGYTMPYRYYSPYSTDPYGTQRLADYRLFGSSVVFFDSHGEIKSDLSLKFPDIKLAAKEQVSDFVYHNGYTSILCKEEKEIIAKVIAPQEADVKEEKIKPELKISDETIHSEKQDDSSIRTWYDNFLYVYGYQIIKEATNKNTRNVFYINKIKVP
ncbi:MAG TPA: hypothetical protein DGG95_02150 [Cytophagales bacterium]|jgi:hypothetical protein|nr:hypothetical protein [Cytophagales bacterium]